MESVVIEKLVHGGQGIGALADGRKVFVWNALPGENVIVNLTKKRRDYAEGVAHEILESSDERTEPIDEAYLSTSPWQIMTYDAENKYKKEILAETFEREHIELPVFNFAAPQSPLQYRNKMEYSFWGDDDGLHLALFHRASHGKRIITGSSIARPEIDEIANKMCSVLNQSLIRASQLKTVVIRCNQAGELVVALFVKDENFPKLKALEGIAKGVAVYFSNPKSPASVLTKKLYTYGEITLSDEIIGTSIQYDVNSFFQVNLPIFEQALDAINDAVGSSKNLVDMYAGVGTIGIPLGASTLVELDKHNIVMAKKNADSKTSVVQASTEQALEYITSDATVIFDPPRAGLHKDVVAKILESKPKKIAYLSCNPSTQARDVAWLKSAYTVAYFEGYNFFPRTPHIESLAVLVKL